MTMKEIDLRKTVYELTEQYPELIDILKEIGFLGVRNPITRKTLGKMTTIPQGCKRMGKAQGEVKAVLKRHGFEVTGDKG